MRTNIIKLTIIFFAGLLLISGCEKKTDPEVAKEISQRINVDPTWAAVREYLFTSLKPGMSRDEVHLLLEEIGEYEIFLLDSPDEYRLDSDGIKLWREQIQFTEENTNIALRQWGFLFDSEDRLVDVGMLDY
ncbi:MAG: hypothetical protein CL609_02140 [Anaerolineaceae bacterium]|nr:hypothetical protein [Anaerolineaceae bacterium]